MIEDTLLNKQAVVLFIQKLKEMFDDSRELSPSPGSIFSQNSRKGLFPRSREVFMDPSANSEFGNSSGRNSGLLRFRSAPSSVLENFTHGVEKSGGSGSRFNLGSINGGLVSQGSLNLEDSGGYKGFVNGFSGLPPQYPRQSSSAQLVDGGGLLGSNLMRQNSSPPGLFSHLTPQNGTVLKLELIISYICFVCFIIFVFVLDGK